MSKGYHSKVIKKGIIGEPSKIVEELEEFIDALDQKATIMSLIELSDLYGAIECYLEKYHPNLSMDDLKKMSELTKRAFKNGKKMNYELLTEAKKHYEKCGFTYIEVPWTVSKRAINITKPPKSKGYKVENKFLVGSAEQSFIQLMLDNKLKKGKYQAITPCFRDEPKHDNLHKPYFMKLELIDADANSKSLSNMIAHSLNFFRIYLDCFDTRIDKLSIDIIDSKHGIELGSYGIRTNRACGPWVFGTGVAEPRLSYVLNL